MWCKICRQDVPAVSLLNEGKFSCPRCGETLNMAQCNAAGRAPENIEQHDSAEPLAPEEKNVSALPGDLWELEDQLRHIERLLGAALDHVGPEDNASPVRQTKIEPPHAVVPPWHVKLAPTAAAKGRRSAKAATVKSNIFIRLLIGLTLSLGSLSFLCGGVLMGWSMATSRVELWEIGIPLAGSGQLALLCGLLLQINRLWLQSRSAAAKLNAVDEQLHELKKSQLDLLSLKLSRIDE
jgi:hypothetical protein